MSGKINIDNLNSILTGVMEDYKQEIVAGLKQVTDEAMADLVEGTKADAPVGKRKKHYRDQIASKTVSENTNGKTNMWYVKGSEYRLSHLLNNGHALRDGGRYPGTNFIGENVDRVTEKFEKEVEGLIKDG